MGDYKSCKSTAKSYYLLGGVLDGGIFSRVGMCLPKECTKEVMYSYNETFAALFSILSKRKVSPSSIYFMDVNAENDVLGEKGLGYNIFWIITGSLIILMVISAILDELKCFTQEKIKESTILKAMQCFSPQRNISGIFNTSNRVDPNLEIFNGIRVLAIGWVVLGHTFQTEAMIPIFNFNWLIREMITNFWMAWLKCGTLAVDTFFFISGFFSALSYFGAFKNPKFRGIAAILTSYLHRYIRLFPILLFSFMMFNFIMPTLNDEPFMPYFKDGFDYCKQYWHLTFLYINNFNAYEKGCLFWTWYLMNDMQFFLITPFIILPFFSSYTRGMMLLLLYSCISICVTAIIYTYYGLHTAIFTPSEYDYMTIFYTKPYCRIIPYFLGIFFYLMYKEHKRSESEPETKILSNIEKFVASREWVKYALYIFGIVLMNCCIIPMHFFDKYSGQWGQGLATLYELSFRPCFIIGIMCLIYPTLIGKGNFLLSIIGHPILNPFGKLTYGVYMLHLVLLYSFKAYSLDAHYVSYLSIWLEFIKYFFITYLASFVAIIIYESPVVQMLKVYLKRI